MEAIKISMNMTAFFGAFVSEIENVDGVTEKMLCIPLHRNGLFESDTHNVNVNLFLQPLIRREGWGRDYKVVILYPQYILDNEKKLGYEGYHCPGYADIIRNKSYKPLYCTKPKRTERKYE